MVEIVKALVGLGVFWLTFRYAFDVEVPRVSLRDFLPQRFRTDP